MRTPSENLLCHPSITQTLFFPRKETVQPGFEVECGNAKLSCVYYKKNPNYKTVVFFHGNGETARDFSELFTTLADLIGFNLFLSEYRGYGQSTGESNLINLIGDVETIINTIPVVHSNIIVFGRSLGSIQALKAISLNPDICGIIIDSGISDLGTYLEEMLPYTTIGNLANDVVNASRHLLNPKNILQEFHGHTLIMHSMFDHNIGVDNAFQLYKWASGPKEIKLFKKGDHNTYIPVNIHEFTKTLLNYLKSLPNY